MKRTSQLLGGFFDSMPRFSAAKSPTAEKHSSVDRPVGEIRNRAFLLEQSFALEVERCSRAIIEASESDEICQRALRWKLGVLHALSLAASSPDPLVSLFDTWVLAEQMREFFATGAGKDVFGAQQALAQQTSGRLIEQFEQAAAALVRDGNAEAGRVAVAEWAQEHPIEDLSFFRSSTAMLYADTAHRVTKGMGDTVVELADIAQDLSYRFKALSVRLPTQAAGEAELLLRDGLGQLDVKGLQASLNGLSDSLTRLDETIKPGLVDFHALGVKAMETVSAERAATLLEIEALANRLVRTLFIGFAVVTAALVTFGWLLWRS